MLILKEKSLSCFKIKFHSEIVFVFFLIFFMAFENPKMALSQPQVDPQSAINSICNMVQDNSLIAGLVGLDQAINICNNINSVGSNQALGELCSIVTGLKIINVDPYCSPQTQQSGQNLSSNDSTGSLTNTNTNNDNNPEANKSGSIIDRLFAFLFGHFGI